MTPTAHAPAHGLEGLGHWVEAGKEERAEPAHLCRESRRHCGCAGRAGTIAGAGVRVLVWSSGLWFMPGHGLNPFNLHRLRCKRPFSRGMDTMCANASALPSLQCEPRECNMQGVCKGEKQDALLECKRGKEWKCLSLLLCFPAPLPPLISDLCAPSAPFPSFPLLYAYPYTHIPTTIPTRHTFQHTDRHTFLPLPNHAPMGTRSSVSCNPLI